ncbi:hypothetical protein [Palleronia caenipelagi]|uniref:DUF11 domain-containing protein n=1 Tax=Palleronia caenipelagi TaxID=2489174 RepID=A0A547PQ41_9RHOB|nr:hypothetical protein [Palleronia caenipelagi]TRD16258.1 hypothetical protein FEV53_14505 [Palleronia caenipelagi]
MLATFVKVLIPVIVISLRALLRGFGLRTRLAVLSLLLYATALGLGAPASAQSLPPNVGSKQLCQYEATPTACQPLPGQAQFGVVYSYEFLVDASLFSGNDPAFPITEDFTNFTPISPNPVVCTSDNWATTFTPNIQSAGPPMLLDLNVTGGQIYSCRLSGVFTGFGTNALNNVHHTGNPEPSDTSERLSTPLPANPNLDADFILEKTVITTPDIDISSGPATATFEITLTRNPNDTSPAVVLGPYFSVFDEMGLNLGSVPLSAVFQTGGFSCDFIPGSNATSTAQSNVCTPNIAPGNALNSPGGTGGLVEFEFPGTNPTIFLQPGDKVVIRFDVEIGLLPNTTCVLSDPVGAYNRAFLALADGTTALNDTDNSNNTTLDVALNATTGISFDPNACAQPTGGGGTGSGTPPPDLKLTKTVVNSQPTYAWNQPIRFLIKVENIDPTDSVYDLNLTDIFQNLAFTPNFDFTVSNVSIVSCGSGNCVLNSWFSGTGHMTSYSDNEVVLTASIPELPAGQSAEFALDITPNVPICDVSSSFPDKFIQNGVYTTFDYIDFTTNTRVGAFAATAVQVEMEPVPPCDIEVIKDILTPPAIEFGARTVYEVTYRNMGARTLTIGTVIDALRITVPNYANSMDVRYRYDCMDNGGVTGYSTTSSPGGVYLTGSVTYTSQPNQGLRLIDHPGPVVFAPGSMLRCGVELIVEEPDVNDPYCFSSVQDMPFIENTTFMD